MKRKRKMARVFTLIAACLSFPLCCLPVCAVVPSYPMFWGSFTVWNESDEVLHVTPIGERAGEQRILLDQMSKFPYAPLFKRADVRLEPGESVRISCRIFDEPMWRLVALVARNERDEYRQLPVDEGPSSLLWASEEPAYKIRSFGELEGVGPKTLEFARKAGRLHVAAWVMIAAGFVPTGLFGLWFALVWRARLRDRRQTGGSS